MDRSLRSMRDDLDPQRDCSERTSGVYRRAAAPRNAGTLGVPGVVLVLGTDLAPAFTRKLQAAGFTIARVSTAEDARRFVTDRIPAAVLLSESPGADLQGVVSWLRDQERLAFVQVLVVVAHGERLRMADAIAAGVDDVIDVSDESRAGTKDAADRVLARIARSQSLAQLALQDPLTELHNRRFLDDRVPAELARAARAGNSASIALVDLDDFKRINDAFGHAAGDRALVAFARALRSGLRAYDVVCRYGGDEFVVLFPDCGPRGARAALAKLCAHRAWALSDLPVVTFSAGIARFPEDGHSWPDLFEVADKNLRLAKDGGRGRMIGASCG